MTFPTLWFCGGTDLPPPKDVASGLMLVFFLHHQMQNEYPAYSVFGTAPPLFHRLCLENQKKAFFVQVHSKGGPRWLFLTPIFFLLELLLTLPPSIVLKRVEVLFPPTHWHRRYTGYLFHNPVVIGEKSRYPFPFSPGGNHHHLSPPTGVVERVRRSSLPFLCSEIQQSVGPSL